MSIQISISLFDNATDELDCFAVEIDAALGVADDISSVAYEESRSLKQAIKHLHNAGELLFKYRLQMEHWSLIFERIDHASKNNLESGSFKSVSYDDAIKRLQNICGIEAEFDMFSKLHNLRNRAEHFSVNIERMELLSLLIPAVDELLKFCSSHIVSSIPGDEPVRFNQAVERVTEAKEALNKYKTEIEGKSNPLPLS